MNKPYADVGIGLHTSLFKPKVVPYELECCACYLPADSENMDWDRYERTGELYCIDCSPLTVEEE